MAQPQWNIPAGWVGGFAAAQPAFSYPDPDLSSLPMLGNMDNVALLQRMQAVEWPEFSWLSVPGDDASRCYRQFAQYISQIGYTNAGRVYSIICPQQGTWIDESLCLNVEVTVTGQRGWVDETTKEMAADMTVEGRVWFSLTTPHPTYRRLWRMLQHLPHPFPLTKAHAIRVQTHRVGEPQQPIFPLRKGVCAEFDNPEFALHGAEAWDVSNLQVQIGRPSPTHVEVVDGFNALAMDLFNAASGNLLQEHNVLTWNVWFRPPQLVDQTAWQEHAEQWRRSIDTHHAPPPPWGPATPPKYFDGQPFSPAKEVVGEALGPVWSYLEEHLHFHL